MDYVNTIFNETPDATEKEKTMVADFIYYIWTVNGESNADAKAVADATAEFRSKDDAYASYELPEAVGDITKYVKSFGYYSVTVGASYRIYLTEEGQASGITVTAKRLDNNSNMTLEGASGGALITNKKGEISTLRSGLIITVKDANGNVLASAGFDMKTAIEGITDEKTQRLYKSLYNFANSAARFSAY
jgi:hypothetical protein